jgi:hypothetical protein
MDLAPVDDLLSAAGALCPNARLAHDGLDGRHQLDGFPEQQRASRQSCISFKICVPLARRMRHQLDRPLARQGMRPDANGAPGLNICEHGSSFPEIHNAQCSPADSTARGDRHTVGETTVRLHERQEPLIFAGNGQTQQFATVQANADAEHLARTQARM